MCAIVNNRVLSKTKDYLDQFARFKKKENVSLVERLLQQETDLAGFERSQLGTLCCETAEEAKTLIPRYFPLSANILFGPS